MSGASLRLVCWDVAALLPGDRDLVTRRLRELGTDVACLRGVPYAVRWRSRTAALAREAGLLYAGGGRTSGGAVLLAAARVDVRTVLEGPDAVVALLRLTGGTPVALAALASVATVPGPAPEPGVEWGAGVPGAGLDVRAAARATTGGPDGAVAYDLDLP